MSYMTSLDGLIREGYSILQIELDSTLSNPLDLFYGRIPTDVLTVLLDKIKAIKLGYPEEFDYDVMQSLIGLEQEIYSKIIKVFEDEFLNGESYILDNFSEISTHSIVNFIYKYFYIYRKSILDEYLADTIFVNKINLAKSYKTSLAKKDITYQAIRTELKVSSPDLYIVIMHAADICEDLLLVEGLDIRDVFSHSSLTETETELVEKLFEYNGVQVCQVLTDSLVKSDAYSQYKCFFKNHMFNIARKIK